MFRIPRVHLVAGVCLAASLVSGSTLSPARAQADLGEDEAALREEIVALDAAFPAFTTIPWSEKNVKMTAFLYGDRKGVVHLMVYDEGKLREKWRSFPLDGGVREVFGQDLDRDGNSEIIAYSAKARIYVWETKTFKVLWESVQEKFTTIQALTIADMDRDPALEIVVCADNKIAYYDGVEFFREKEGRDPLDPAVLLIADVDGDLANEIVTNDGYVLDASSLNIEWATDGFGYPMTLFDIDNDGVLEILGEVGGSLVIWDAEDQREIW